MIRSWSCKSQASSNPANCCLHNGCRDLGLGINRDDKTAIELFLTGIWGWEAGLRRKLENGKSG